MSATMNLGVGTFAKVRLGGSLSLRALSSRPGFTCSRLDSSYWRREHVRSGSPLTQSFPLHLHHSSSNFYSCSVIQRDRRQCLLAVHASESEAVLQNKHVSERCIGNTRHIDSKEAEEAYIHNRSKGKRVKKRVAMFCGYVGSKYRGLQINRTAQGETVESVLEKALLDAGCISQMNYGDLKKVRWTRSSRTDKGVHSVSTVLSLRMLVDVDAFDNSDYNTDIADEINSYLPKEIKVFCVQKVTKGFTARHGCENRTYHYYLPLKPILKELNRDSTEKGRKLLSPDDVVAALRDILKLYNGKHPFHNYTDRKRYTYSNPMPEHIRDYYRPRSMIDASNKENAERGESGGRIRSDAIIDDEGGEVRDEQKEVIDDSDDDNDDAEDARCETSCDSSKEDESPYSNDIEQKYTDVDIHVKKRYVRFPRKCWWNDEIDYNDPINKKHYRMIYDFNCSEKLIIKNPNLRSESTSSSGDEHNESPCDCPALRIEIKGGSFMLYQIRYMIGTAVGVVLGHLPSEIIPVSISAPARFNHLPLAPPSTLMLADAHFFPLRTPHGDEKRYLRIDREGESLREEFIGDTLLPSLYPILISDEWDIWISRLPKEEESYYDKNSLDEVIGKHSLWHQDRVEKGIARRLERENLAELEEHGNKD